jgi:hypothetical protein
MESGGDRVLSCFRGPAIEPAAVPDDNASDTAFFNEP